MLFEAWTANPYMGAPFDGHPFNRLNNVNGVDGDPETPPIPAELNPDGDRTTLPRLRDADHPHAGRPQNPRL